MEKMVYMVTTGSVARVLYNKKQAFQMAKLTGNTAQVYRLSYGYYRDCGLVMDEPTFRIVGERIIEKGEVTV